MEGNDTTLEKVDVSRLISVWNESGITDDVISWPDAMPDNFRAYVMRKNTGIDKVPAGAIALVDPSLRPGNEDLVIANIRGEISAYRFLDGGTEHGFLGVDNDRVPLFEVKDPSSIIGVIEQILIRKLR